MPILFALTLFISALLLFMVQPMIGRMVLPLLGGSPAAWNTCMVFFQFMLLLGYLYAHKLTARLSTRQQILVHAGVLGIAIASFGFAVMLGERASPVAIVKTLAPQDTAYPMFGVMALLFVAIGIPFFAVSATAPLLQRWFSKTGHRTASDPYFLYAASNAGSLLSLLLYPLLTEPSLTLKGQAWLFAAGFAALAVLIGVCAARVPNAPREETDQSIGDRRRIIKWVALAFVPSSLMLGVTFYMTTDIASIPLLWVIPLALYLLTFIIAFMRTPPWLRVVLGNLAPVATLLLLFVIITKQSLDSPFLLIALHLVAFFLMALMCHSELARDRPPPQFLTNYFLWISVGGVLGGIFNALIAPILFPYAYEYTIALSLGCLLVPKLTDEKTTPERASRARLLDFLIPFVLFVVVVNMTAWLQGEWMAVTCRWVSDNVTSALAYCGLGASIGARQVHEGLLYALPLIACFFFIDRPLRFGLCVAAVVFVGEFRRANEEVHTERSFFGILKIQQWPRDDPDDRRLVHGTTLHGVQGVSKWPRDLVEAQPLAALVGPGPVYGFDWSAEPLTYYHRTGPVGHMFTVTKERHPKANVAMVGLGTGSVSCYADKNLALTFYEIDPTVKKLVADTDQYFTYVTDARNRGAKVDFILGDARLKLEERADVKYDLLLVDAFSSDSIPVHLLTKEALELYLNRLTPNGLLGLHISNKFVKLDAVVARLAEELHITALIFDDRWYEEKGDIRQQYGPPGKTLSDWVVLSKDPALLEIFKEKRFTTQYPYLYEARDADGKLVPRTPAINAWDPMVANPLVKAWTDDYADVLMVMRLKQVQRMRNLFGLPTLPELLE